MRWFKSPKDLYEMLVLENVYFGNSGNFVTRVPGGWIFTFVGAGIKRSSTFVPFSNEFQHLSDEDIQSMVDQDPEEEGPGETGEDRE